MVKALLGELSRVGCLVVLAALAISVGAGCGSSSSGASKPCSAQIDCTAGESCVDSECRADAVADAGPACRTDIDCSGGACVDGTCCEVANVCGRSCCGTGETCFANACVTPGGACVGAVDCAEGEYCETGLGDGASSSAPDAGVGGGVCLGGGESGRCLALPPRCAAGEDASDGHCIPVCEYHPTAGPLNAVEQWRWSPDTVVDSTAATDVWATPAVGRVFDTNCDGQIDIHDPPNVVFVSGDAKGTCCSCDGANPSTCKTGVLRILDGLTGAELMSVQRAETGSTGFAGLSVALGDVDGDGVMEIIAVTGEGKIAILKGDGTVLRVSADVIPGSGNRIFGWGGALAVADMDGDGFLEIAYGRTVFTTAGGGLSLLFEGSAGRGGGIAYSLSTFVDLDGDGDLELLAGRTAYQGDGTIFWDRPDLVSGFPGVADFDGDGAAEVVLVSRGSLLILEGLTGATEVGPFRLPGSGSGGPPTIADMDGDGKLEIGLAQREFYSVMKPDYSVSPHTMSVLWSTANHDLSSSITGSTVFDFEGDGKAEVVYNDECFLWVYDGATGDVRFAAPTLSFTATESSLVADIDGDGHAEMLMISNGANPEANGWKCNVAPWNVPDPATGRPAWVPAPGSTVWRGVSVFRDAANSWVGTRALWNQHTYHVTNVCDSRDDACLPAGAYGEIPKQERRNWTVPWLNNFRQNVQDGRLFDAPDAVLSLSAECQQDPILHAALRNVGASLLPAGVVVGFYAREASGDVRLGQVVSASPLFPGQASELAFTATGRDGRVDQFVAKVEIDPAAPLFRECHEDNNVSEPVRAHCLD